MTGRAWLPWAIGGAVAAVLLFLLRHVLGAWLLLAVLVLVVVALVVWILMLVRQLRQTQASEAIEETITTQADVDIERSTPGQLAEMSRLKQDLLDAVATLKRSRSGAGALARLPWYLLIGPAASGKSELVRRSGLRFPLQDEARNPRAVRGLGGTRGFSWWLAEEAVLLDLSGKTLATAAFDDEGEWVAFLETLRRQRGDTPLNGALVVVAADQIADQPEARIDSTARAARERLQEIIEHLGVVFPVYVVFTRCDRVAGFSEFFADLASGEREEPWGATVSVARTRAHAAEELFDEELDVLLAAISERRLPRMAAMPDPPARARAFAFPLQLERLRAPLKRFMRTLFTPAAGAEPPLFRGFYLAASTTDGEPTDRVIQPAARALGLSVRSADPVAADRGGAWFVRRLFPEVVFPDAGLAVASRGASGLRRRGERLAILIAGLAVLLFTLVFAGASCSNRALVAHARKAAVEVARRVSDDAALVDNLRRLDALRSATDELDRVRRHVPFVRRLGGWSGDVVRGPATELWMRRTMQHVLVPVVRVLEDSLRARAAGAPGTFLEDVYRLHAWRLLTDPRELDPEDDRVLAREVTRALGDRLELGGTDAAGRSEYPELVRRQMTFLAGHGRDLAAVVRDYVEPPDRALTARMAAIVRDEWSPPAFYAELGSDAERATRPIRFADLAGSTSLMRDDVTVAGTFGRDGWKQAVEPRVDWYARFVRRDALLQETMGGRAADLQNDLLALYAADVTRHWAAFLAGAEYANPTSLEGVADQLARLARSDSPLFKLLRGVHGQVEGISAAGTPLDGIGRDFRLLNDFFAAPGTAGQRTQDFLAELKRRLPGQGGTPSTVRESIESQYLRYLGKAQGDVAKLGPAAPLQRIQELLSPPPDQTNGVFELVSFADGVSQGYADSPIATETARLLRAPVDAARRVVRERGLGPRVAAAWQSTVLDRFRRDLGSAYPFSGAGRDASLDDVAACFGPQGYFWAFYTAYLAPYVNEDGSPKSADAPPVSAAMIDFLRKASAIRRTFFAAGPQPALAFTVGTSPPQHDAGAIVRWVAFDCGGQTVTYTMGPPEDQPLQWPGTDPLAPAQIRAQAAPAAPPKKKKGAEPVITIDPLKGTGPWGLFRLVDRATRVTASGSTASVTWTLPMGGGSPIETTWDLKVTGGESPFARGFLRMVPPASP